MMTMRLILLFFSLLSSTIAEAKVACDYTQLKKITCHFDQKKEELTISAFKKDMRIPGNIKKKIISQYYQKNQIPSEK